MVQHGAACRAAVLKELLSSSVCPTKWILSDAALHVVTQWVGVAYQLDSNAAWCSMLVLLLFAACNSSKEIGWG